MTPDNAAVVRALREVRTRMVDCGNHIRALLRPYPEVLSRAEVWLDDMESCLGNRRPLVEPRTWDLATTMRELDEAEANVDLLMTTCPDCGGWRWPDRRAGALRCAAGCPRDGRLPIPDPGE